MLFFNLLSCGFLQETAALLERERGDEEARWEEAREVKQRLQALKVKIYRKFSKVRFFKRGEGGGGVGGESIIWLSWGLLCIMRFPL